MPEFLTNNLYLIDIAIVVSVFVGLATIAMITKRYTKDVADFLAANRCAGRYLLTLADGMASMGAIAVIASFQQYYEAGFAAGWWGNILAPVGLAITLSGFIAYRFRQTRVMTIAQFYELRYSRRFRIFTGILAWVAGVINYGIFPAVTARFFIYFCGFPIYILPVGPLELNLTLGFVMAVLLTTAVLITLRGGQIAILVTDFFQAQYVNVAFLVIMIVLFWQFNWSDIVEGLKKAPEGKSMLNPFRQADIPDFNLWFYFMSAFNLVYSYMAWQGTQGYYCSAKTPHDAKMARILGMWRFGVTWTVITLIPVCAYVLLNTDVYPDKTASALGAIEALGDEGLVKQLTVPLALREILPVGVFGMFVAAMLAAAVSTDDTYLHSWGSIFIQDVVLPFRKKELLPHQHLAWLRRSIVGVAVFAWVFGMLFPLQEYIFMYWAITGAIYVGGAGSVIIGGFYWRRATTAGAWAGMIVGSTLAFVGIVINNVVWPYLVPHWKEVYPHIPWLQSLPETFWLNGMQIYFSASLLAICAYVGVSLLTKPAPGFDLDKILHRGKYAVEGDHQKVDPGKKGLMGLLGVDEEYTTFDKILAVFLFCWTNMWFLIFIFGTIYALKYQPSDDSWANYWLFTTVLAGVMGAATIVWFLWGGFRDLRDLFVSLNAAKHDMSDDGMVHDQQPSDQQ